MAQLKALVDQLAAVPQRHCEKDHMSGSIYSFSYWSQADSESKGTDPAMSEDVDAPAEPNSPEDYLQLSRKLKQIYT